MDEGEPWPLGPKKKQSRSDLYFPMKTSEKHLAVECGLKEESRMLGKECITQVELPSTAIAESSGVREKIALLLQYVFLRGKKIHLWLIPQRFVRAKNTSAFRDQLFCQLILSPL